MDTAIPGVNFSTLGNHLPLFVLLLIAVPLLSWQAIKLWIVIKAALDDKARKEWSVSPDRDANGIPIFFDQDSDRSDAPDLETRRTMSLLRRSSTKDAARSKHVA
jgi:hypothetical protein